MSTTTIENLQADFELLDDWEERYRYVIELGRLLPPFDEKFRNAQYKVSGCASQVWIHAEHNGAVLTFTGDSDALIVKGLIAITFMIFSGKTPEQILALDANAIFAKLGLKDHLTPQRSNGLASMVARIKADARQVLAA
ncbi:MAG TPA: SufE family protein [Aestuariivirga sp.]|nr:SufE family protein [Hyphomicrobiales bacterium]HQX85007.1 SufE family protein [Aestuariivirga sp.]HQY74260.1 SufE family protein [Aestuariivirga sp.]HRA92489.1 SufE family protein [Aestuariivirga sp.]